MESKISNYAISLLKRECPELIPIVVALQFGATVGVDATSMPSEELRWLKKVITSVVIYDNPMISMPREPTGILITGSKLDLNAKDRFSPVHVVYLPVRDSQYRLVLEKALAFVGPIVPQQNLKLMLSPEDEFQPTVEPTPALFLDRDGTMIDLVPYITDHNLVSLKDGIRPLMHWAREKGMLIVCVTNQSGIGRGMYTWQQFTGVQNRMIELLSREGLAIDATFAAGYFSESDFAEGHLAPSLRKPAPGMLTWAARKLNISLSRSIMIGDSSVDVEAGERACCSYVYRISNTFTLSDILHDLRSNYSL